MRSRVIGIRLLSFLLGVASFLVCVAISRSQEGILPGGCYPPEYLKQQALERQINAGFENLKPIFKRGCFDCHSDQTDYPWYHSLPVIKGWMDEHVAEARDELDFSPGFPFGGHHNKRQADNLYKIKHELEEGAMPLKSYRFMHWGAAPNDEEKDSIYAWVDRSLILLASHGQYPFNRPERVPGAK